MQTFNYFCVLLTILYCLPVAIWSGPVPGSPESCQGSGLYNFEAGKEYQYDFFTKTKLWINDVSDEAESDIMLNATVLLQRVEPCRYQLKLRNVVAYVNSNNRNVAAELEQNVAVFSVANNGALSPLVKFNGADSNWARNIKRGIISAFQWRSPSDLKVSDPTVMMAGGSKSSVVYETDLFGKCRTTYKLKSSGTQKLQFAKKKALHRCSLDLFRDSPLDAETYDSVVEYYNGHTHIENHACEAQVSAGVLEEVECKHESTLRTSSRGDNGLQAVAKLVLKLKGTGKAGDVAALDRAAPSSILHDYEPEPAAASSLKIADFVASVCKNTNEGVLDQAHAQNFRELVNALKSKSKAELLALVNDASSKCKFAANTLIAGIVFAETDASVEAVLDLLDKDSFKDAVLLTEYPLLTAVARDRHPSAALISKFKAYLAGKDAKFVYLQKTYLIYSTIVARFCSANDCSGSLDDWTSVLSAQLGSNCADSSNKGVVVGALKAIGNIGHAKDVSVLEKCAANKDNSLEVRVAAVQALRRFSCSRVENLDGNYKLLQDANDDAEVRINAFRSLVRCLNSAKFQTFASKAYGEFLAKEEDYQVVSYIIDFAKERGVTVLLNPILNNPEIRDKLQLNFKEFSWNNYKYRYSPEKDAALEVDTSVIYTSKTFIPRSLNFNITAHGFGLRINALDVTVRLEGLDEVLKGLLVDKLSSEQLLKRLSEKPEQLLDILKGLADKLKYSAEKPYVSLSIRVYGSDVFFVQLDTLEKLQIVSGLVRDWKNVLYKERNVLRNMQLFNSLMKKPLINGFEFSAEGEVNVAVLHVRKGDRQVKGAKTEFNLKLQNGASLFTRRQFSVEINPANKVSLRKDVNGYLRFKLDYDGNRQDGVVVYNINIAPQEVVQLFVLEGKYYKLDGDSKYIEVKKFEIPSVTKNLCTSENFHDHVGLDVCFSVQRPSFRKLREIVKSIRDRENDMDVLEDSDDFDFDAVDDDDDDNDDDDRPERPMISLAGPFRYELALRNTDQISKFVINGKTTKSETSKKFEGSLQSSSLNKKAQRRLDFTYSRHRTVTSRTYNRGLVVELKVPQDDDVRFHFSSLVDYRKKELLDYKLKIENKILKEFNFNVNFNRKHKEEGQSVSNYNLQATLDSKLGLLRPESEGAYVNLQWTLEGIEKSVKSEFFVENRDMRFVQANFDLDHRAEPQYDRDYDLKLTANSLLGQKLDVNGHLGYGLLASNIDLSGSVSSQEFQLPRPLNIKIGHALSAGAESHVHFDLTLPISPVSHGGKVLFQFTPLVKSLALEINTPESKKADSPRKIFFKFQKNEDDSEKHFEIGFRNFNIDLTDRQTRLATLIKKTTNDNILREFSIEYENVRNAEQRRRDVSLEVDLNENTISSVHLFAFGNLEALRANPDEIAEQELGAGFDFRVLEHKGGVKGNIKVANSKSKKTRAYNVHILVNDLLKPVLRMSEADVDSKLDNGKIVFKVNLQKENDQYKSLELNANGAVRNNGEFDFDYVRVLNDGSKKTGKGVAKYSLTDFKNIEASLSVPNALEIKAVLKNERKEGHVLHNVKLGLTHKDVPTPAEKSFEFEFHKHSDKTDTVELKIDARNGKPGSLAAEAGLTYLVSLGGKLTKAQGQLIGYHEYLKYKSAERKFDINTQSTFSVDVAKKELKLTSKSDSKFPSMTQAGAVRFLKRDLTVVLSADKMNLNVNYETSTDSTVFGRFFRFVKFDYSRKIGQGSKLVDVSLNADYRKAPSEQDATPQQKNLNVKFGVTPCSNGVTCFGAQLDIAQQATDTCPKSSLIIDYTRTGTGNTLNFQTGLKAICDGLTATNTKLQFQRSADKNANVKRELKLTSESDIYSPKKFEWGFLPFNKHSGYAKLGIHWDDEVTGEDVFEYTREVDAATGKGKSANYKASASFKGKYKKVCELNIDRKGDYTNKLSCAMTVPSSPKAVNYGYRVFVANPQEIFFGQRHFELSVQLPTSRVLQVEYKGFKATPIDGTDDDSDPNDEREFNGTANLYWDYAADKKKVVVINLKRDNIAPGHFKFFIEAVNTPLIKTSRLELNHKRTFNETSINLGLSYDLKSGKSNRLDFNGKTTSDLVENQFSLEVNLQRPKFNVHYSNEFDKRNGRLNKLRLRVAELLTVVVDKEFDPNNRRISMELNNAAGSKYQLDAKANFENDVYTVQGSLKHGAKLLSTVNSVYDSLNTKLSVKANGHVTKANYELTVGLVNESFASVYLTQENKAVGVGSVKLSPVNLPVGIRLHDLVVSLRWNRFWHKFQEDLVGGADSPSASPSAPFNSYLGDIYAELAGDLKPVIDSIRETRALIREDLGRSALLQLEFYSEISPRAAAKRQQLLQAGIENKMAKPEIPLHVRLFARYNALAEKLNAAFEAVYSSKARRLAKYIPRLARISYNGAVSGSSFANNLEVSKRMVRASNLYQFNQEYRNRVRRLGALVLRVKSLLLRDVKSISLRALVNKYKYRSIRYDFTTVGSVYNKRNIIGFGGESESLHTKARYLLAHDTSKNRFSVILNYDDTSATTLSVFFYGKGPIGISSDKATVDGKAIAVPREINLDNGKSIFISRVKNGICAHVDFEVKVCCFEDSNSCTVALTRWWTGKVNGLFGKTNNFPQKIKQEDWAVEKVDPKKVQLKPSSDEAVKTCYKLFGRHRRSPFRSVFMAVRPNGWRKVCESALTFDTQKNYCPLLRAFAEHAQFEYVHVDVPAECYKCNNAQLSKSYNVGEKVPESEADESVVDRGLDFVFLSLPCDKQKFAFNYEALVQRFNKNKQAVNNYYAVKVEKDETSVYQADNGVFVNFDVKAAAPVIQRDANGQINEEAFYEGIHLAQALFSRRVAEARYLVIVSCGNCLPYSARKARKLAKELSARNIIVSSWGDYNMKLGEDGGDDVAVGYNEDDLYVYPKGSKEIVSESLSGFKVDHEADLCHRVATRTHGSVFDLKELRKQHILEKVPEWFQESKAEHSFSLKSCEIVHNRHYGDFADFKFSKITHEAHDEDDLIDN